MEDKRLDYNAPLLSVRRFKSSISSSATAAAAAATAKSEVVVDSTNKNSTPPPPPEDGPSLPFYKSDLKSVPIRNPAVVPFLWEQAPGQPKNDSDSGDAKSLGEPPVVSKLPPAPRTGNVSSSGQKPEIDKDATVKEKKSSEEQPILKYDSRRRGDGDEEDAFLDALETLTRTESCSMNCSVSGITGVGEPVTGKFGSSFSTDPQVRDFMMERFLPAAQAMTTGSPHRYSRKTVSLAREHARSSTVLNGTPRRLGFSLQQNRPNSILRYPRLHQEGKLYSYGDDNDDDGFDDDDDDGARQLRMRGCGFLPKFCLKGSYGLMNPLPGVRVRDSRFRPAIKSSSHQRSVAGAEDESWEAVYRHKLGHGLQQMQGGDGSKPTTESYPITYWSNSQSPNGSSPYHYSNIDGTSPSPFHEWKGFLGVPICSDRIGKTESFGSTGSDKYWEVRPHLSSKSGSGSGSPALEKTLYVDSVCMPETPNSKSSSVDTKFMINSVDKDSPLSAAESGRMDENFISESKEENTSQSEVVETDLPFPRDGTNAVGEMGDKEEFREDVVIDCSETTKLEDNDGKKHSNFFQTLLPPPLPKSPSESWLWRTLPSVSSKNPTPQTFLGMQFSSNKKTAKTSSAAARLGTIVKSSNKDSNQMSFSEVLPKHVREDR